MGPHQACIICCTATIAALLSHALLLQQCCWPPGPRGPGVCGSCVRFWLWGKVRSSVFFIWLLSCSRSELSSKRGVPEWLFWTWTGGGLQAGDPRAPCTFSESWVQGWRVVGVIHAVQGLSRSQSSLRAGTMSSGHCCIFSARHGVCTGESSVDVQFKDRWALLLGCSWWNFKLLLMPLLPLHPHPLGLTWWRCASENGPPGSSCLRSANC